MRKTIRNRMAALLLLILCAALMTVPALGVEEEISMGVVVDILEEPVPLAPSGTPDLGVTDLPGDSVPLAEVPVTGDSSTVTGILAIVAGIGLVIVGRKLKNAA